MMKRFALLLSLLLASLGAIAQTTVTIGENTGNTFAGSRLFELNQADPTTVYHDGAEGRVKLGTGANEERSIVTFSGLSNVSGPVEVTAATLRVYKTNASDISASSLELYRLRRASEHLQATWNVYTTGNSWQTAGAKGALDVVTSATILQTGPGASTGYIAFSNAQLAQDVEDMINGATTGGIGWVIASTDQFSRIILAAEGATDTQRPYLEFTYTAAGGASGLLLRRRRS